VRRLSFVAAVVVFAPLLGGPTPGAVGSCGGDDLDRFADLDTYCVEREDLVCVRRWNRGEISETEMNECRYDARDLCERRTWSADCRPTERQARACLNALAARDTLETPEDEIDECRVEALCTVRTVGAAGSGGS